jgi:DNA-binding MarR family transcriptional regulator
MGIIRNFKATSPATTHARIKKLVRHGLIDRVADETNLRIKKLQPTAKYNDLVKYLGEI